MCGAGEEQCLQSQVQGYGQGDQVLQGESAGSVWVVEDD